MPLEALPDILEELRSFSENDGTSPLRAGRITQSLAPIGEAAYYGLAGDIVRMLEPQTEADPVALLIHVLVGMGNLWGRGPHFRVGARAITPMRTQFVLGRHPVHEKELQNPIRSTCSVMLIHPGWASELCRVYPVARA